MNGSTEAPIYRIVWLCEELGIAYEMKRYERDPVTRLAPLEYQSLHPIGTAPIITDGDLVLGESAAIIDYIIHKYGQGRLSPASGDPTYADYLFWFHFANGSFMPAAMMGLVAGMAAAAGSAAPSGSTGPGKWSRGGWAKADFWLVQTSPQRIS